MYLQWQNTVENSRHRDQLINTTGEQYGSAKDYLDRKKNEKEQHQSRLDREKESNKEAESSIVKAERDLEKIRVLINQLDKERAGLEGQVSISRN